MSEKALAQQLAEHRVRVLLEEESAHRQSPAETEKLLDDPKFRAHPDFRAALLKKLQELGRVPSDKE